MDFYVSFELDEGFNETIKSRHRDEFTYDSFSEGEKIELIFTPFHMEEGYQTEE